MIYLQLLFCPKSSKFWISQFPTNTHFLMKAISNVFLLALRPHFATKVPFEIAEIKASAILQLMRYPVTGCAIKLLTCAVCFGQNVFRYHHICCFNDGAHLPFCTIILCWIVRDFYSTQCLTKLFYIIIHKLIINSFPPFLRVWVFLVNCRAYNICTNINFLKVKYTCL